MEVKQVMIFANSPNKLSLRAGLLTRQTFKVNSGVSGQFSKILQQFQTQTNQTVTTGSHFRLLRVRLTLFITFVYYSFLIRRQFYRYFEYAAIKSELYMLDFCYFVNFNVAIQTAFFPDNLEWWVVVVEAVLYGLGFGSRWRNDGRFSLCLSFLFNTYPSSNLSSSSVWKLY